MDLEFQANKMNIEFLPAFEGMRYSLYTAFLNEKSKLTVFYCIADTINVLEENWKELTDCISHDYLTADVSEFERWNSYLFFISDEPVPKTLKYEIENDKFAMRKIVEQKPVDWEDKSPENALIKLLNHRLLLSHIDLSGYKADGTLISPVMTKWGQNIVDQEVPFDNKVLSKEARAAWIKENLVSAMIEVSNED